MGFLPHSRIDSRSLTMPTKQLTRFLQRAANRERLFLVLIGIMLVAVTFLARLPDLRARPLWYDEAFSVLFSRTGFKPMLEATLSTSTGGAAEEHPLLYYTLLWVWMQVFGSGVVAVRLLSVLFSLVQVVLIWGFMKDVFSIPIALAAGVLFALSPFQVHYGQEARMYGLLSLWILLCMWMAWRGTTQPGWGSWIIFGISAALAMYTHTLAAIFLIPIAFTPFLLKSSQRWRRLFMAGIFAILLYLPWGLHLPQQFLKVSHGYWIDRPTLASLLQTALGFITGLPLSGVVLILGLFLALAIYIFSVIQAVRSSRGGMPGRIEAGWIAVQVLAPVIILFVVSLWHPVYLVRVLLPAGTMLLLWLAWVWASAEVPRSGQVLIVTAFSCSILLGHYSRLTYRDFPYAPFEQVANYLRGVEAPQDVILHANKISMLPLAYYAPDLQQEYLADPAASGSDTLAQPTQELLGLMAETDIADAVHGAQHVYFIIFEQEIEDYLALGLKIHPSVQWLEEHYQLQEVEHWGDLLVYFFGDSSGRTPETFVLPGGPG